MADANEIVNKALNGDDNPSAYVDWLGKKADVGEVGQVRFGFHVHTTDEEVITINAKEAGITTDDEFWKQIANDIRWLEENAAVIARKFGLYIQGEGHDQSGAYVASAWVTALSARWEQTKEQQQKQVEVVKKILALDGDMPNTGDGSYWTFFPGSETELYKDVSEHGRSLIDVTVEFTGTEALAEWLKLNIVEAVDDPILQALLDKASPEPCFACSADLTQPFSVVRTYIPKVEGAIDIQWEGHYDATSGYFTPDERMSSGTIEQMPMYDLPDDCDNCKKCGKSTRKDGSVRNESVEAGIDDPETVVKGYQKKYFKLFYGRKFGEGAFVGVYNSIESALQAAKERKLRKRARNVWIVEETAPDAGGDSYRQFPAGETIVVGSEPTGIVYDVVKGYVTAPHVVTENVDEPDPQRYLAQLHDLTAITTDIQNYGMFVNRIHPWGRWIILSGGAYWATENSGSDVPLTAEYFNGQVDKFMTKLGITQYHIKSGQTGLQNEHVWFQLGIPKSQVELSSWQQYRYSTSGPLDSADVARWLPEALDPDAPEANIQRHTQDIDIIGIMDRLGFHMAEPFSTAKHASWEKNVGNVDWTIWQTDRPGEFATYYTDYTDGASESKHVTELEQFLRDKMAAQLRKERRNRRKKLKENTDPDDPSVNVDRHIETMDPEKILLPLGYRTVLPSWKCSDPDYKWWEKFDNNTGLKWTVVRKSDDAPQLCEVSVYTSNKRTDSLAGWREVGGFTCHVGELATMLAKAVKMRWGVEGDDRVWGQNVRALNGEPEPPPIGEALDPDDAPQNVERFAQHVEKTAQEKLDTTIASALSEFDTLIDKRNVTTARAADELAVDVATDWATNGGYDNGSDEFDYIVSAVNARAGELFPGDWENYPVQEGAENVADWTDFLSVAVEAEALSRKDAIRYQQRQNPEANEQIYAAFIEMDEASQAGDDELMLACLRRIGEVVRTTNMRYGSAIKDIIRDLPLDETDLDSPEANLERYIPDMDDTEVFKKLGFKHYEGSTPRQFPDRWVLHRGHRMAKLSYTDKPFVYWLWLGTRNRQGEYAQKGEEVQIHLRDLPNQLKLAKLIAESEEGDPEQFIKKMPLEVLARAVGDRSRIDTLRFDCAKWFEQATLEDLTLLAKGGMYGPFNRCYSSEMVGRFMIAHDPKLAALFERNERPDVYISDSDAKRWVEHNRPDWYATVWPVQESIEDEASRYIKQVPLKVKAEITGDHGGPIHNFDAGPYLDHLAKENRLDLMLELARTGFQTSYAADDVARFFSDTTLKDFWGSHITDGSGFEVFVDEDDVKHWVEHVKPEWYPYLWPNDHLIEGVDDPNPQFMQDTFDVPTILKRMGYEQHSPASPWFKVFNRMPTNLDMMIEVQRRGLGGETNEADVVYDATLYHYLVSPNVKKEWSPIAHRYKRNNKQLEPMLKALEARVKANNLRGVVADPDTDTHPEFDDFVPESVPIPPEDESVDDPDNAEASVRDAVRTMPNEQEVMQRLGFDFTKERSEHGGQTTRWNKKIAPGNYSRGQLPLYIAVNRATEYERGDQFQYLVSLLYYFDDSYNGTTYEKVCDIYNLEATVKQAVTDWSTVVIRENVDDPDDPNVALAAYTQDLVADPDEVKINSHPFGEAEAELKALGFSPSWTAGKQTVFGEREIPSFWSKHYSSGQPGSARILYAQIVPLGDNASVSIRTRAMSTPVKLKPRSMAHAVTLIKDTDAALQRAVENNLSRTQEIDAILTVLDHHRQWCLPS